MMSTLEFKDSIGKALNAFNDIVGKLKHWEEGAKSWYFVVPGTLLGDKILGSKAEHYAGKVILLDNCVVVTVSPVIGENMRIVPEDRIVEVAAAITFINIAPVRSTLSLTESGVLSSHIRFDLDEIGSEQMDVNKWLAHALMENISMLCLWQNVIIRCAEGKLNALDMHKVGCSELSDMMDKCKKHHAEEKEADDGEREGK